MQRAVAILGELADARTELGTNEIARRTGINVSTISRILATLASGGLVEHVPATGRYRLGLGSLRLANGVHERLDIRALARATWDGINGINLAEHILPMRDLADVVVVKARDHSVGDVEIRCAG